MKQPGCGLLHEFTSPTNPAGVSPPFTFHPSALSTGCFIRSCTENLPGISCGGEAGRGTIKQSFQVAPPSDQRVANSFPPVEVWRAAAHRSDRSVFFLKEAGLSCPAWAAEVFAFGPVRTVIFDVFFFFNTVDYSEAVIIDLNHAPFSRY